MADWVASLDINGWSVLFAVLTGAATWIIARLARQATRRLLARVPSLAPTVQTIAHAPERDVYQVQFWHHPLHGIAVRSAVVEAIAATLAARSLAAVVTSETPPAPLSPPDGI